MVERPDPHMRQTDAFSWYMERDPLLRSTVVTVLVLDREPDPARLLADRAGDPDRARPPSPSGRAAAAARRAPLGCGLELRPLLARPEDRGPDAEEPGHRVGARAQGGHGGLRPGPAVVVVDDGRGPRGRAGRGDPQGPPLAHGRHRRHAARDRDLRPGAGRTGARARAGRTPAGEPRPGAARARSARLRRGSRGGRRRGCARRDAADDRPDPPAPGLGGGRGAADRTFDPSHGAADRRDVLAAHARPAPRLALRRARRSPRRAQACRQGRGRHAQRLVSGQRRGRRCAATTIATGARSPSSGSRCRSASASRGTRRVGTASP